MDYCPSASPSTEAQLLPSEPLTFHTSGETVEETETASSPIPSAASIVHSPVSVMLGNHHHQEISKPISPSKSLMDVDVDVCDVSKKQKQDMDTLPFDPAFSSSSSSSSSVVDTTDEDAPSTATTTTSSSLFTSWYQSIFESWVVCGSGNNDADNHPQHFPSTAPSSPSSPSSTTQITSTFFGCLPMQGSLQQQHSPPSNNDPRLQLPSLRMSNSSSSSLSTVQVAHTHTHQQQQQQRRTMPPPKSLYYHSNNNNNNNNAYRYLIRVRPPTQTRTPWPRLANRQHFYTYNQHEVPLPSIISSSTSSSSSGPKPILRKSQSDSTLATRAIRES